MLMICNCQLRTVNEPPVSPSATSAVMVSNEPAPSSSVPRTYPGSFFSSTSLV